MFHRRYVFLLNCLAICRRSCFGPARPHPLCAAGRPLWPPLPRALPSLLLNCASLPSLPSFRVLFHLACRPFLTIAPLSPLPVLLPPHGTRSDRRPAKARCQPDPLFAIFYLASAPGFGRQATRCFASFGPYNPSVLHDGLCMRLFPRSPGRNTCLYLRRLLFCRATMFTRAYGTAWLVGSFLFAKLQSLPPVWLTPSAPRLESHWHARYLSLSSIAPRPWREFYGTYCWFTCYTGNQREHKFTGPFSLIEAPLFCLS